MIDELMSLASPIRLFMLTFVSLVSSLFLMSNGVAQTGVEDLRCEYMERPIGIDASHPRFAWRLSKEPFSVASIMMIVDKDSLAVANGKGSGWNSGWIRSSINLYSYNGEALKPFTKYYWRIQLRDASNKQYLTSAVSSFETGMVDQANWKGAWISDVSNVNLKPAPYFRKAFTAAKPIRQARAYIAVAGLYELYINGSKVGNHRLDPMYTRFDRRTLYVTYDVTPQLQRGK